MVQTIKYVGARGKVERVRIWQGSYDTFINRKIERGPTMAEADARMARSGFVRAGRRWRRPRT